MLVLAIEASSNTVSAAILEGTNVLASRTSADQSLPKDQNSEGLTQVQIAEGFSQKRVKGKKTKASRIFPPGASTLLAPMIQDLFQQTELQAAKINLFALTNGPGLFTGLRVAVVTAKTLAYATKAELIGLNTLETIAAAMAKKYPVGTRIRPVINAQRQQLFCGQYVVAALGGVEQVAENEILSRENWLSSLVGGDVVTGSGLAPMLDALNQHDFDLCIAPQSEWQITAEDVGRIGFEKFQSGQKDDLWSLQPFYFRPSAAEEALAARIKQQ